MSTLYPIIRRPRRSLLPPDEPGAVVVPEPPVSPLSTLVPVLASESASAPVAQTAKPPRKRKDEAKPKES